MNSTAITRKDIEVLLKSTTKDILEATRKDTRDMLASTTKDILEATRKDTRDMLASTTKDILEATRKDTDDVLNILKDFIKQTDDRFNILEFKMDNRFNKIELEIIDLKKSQDKLLNTIDGFVARIDRYETEQTARDSQFNKLLDWARKVSKQTGIPLEYL